MKRLIPILAILIIFATCKKSDTSTTPTPTPTPTTGNILASNASIIDTTSIVNVTINSLIINKNNTLVKPKVGDILLASPSLKNPYGLMVKVLNISENGNQYTVSTEQSNLNDAFKQLDINYTNNSTFAASATYKTNGMSVSLNLANNIGIGNGIKLNGKLNFNLSSQLEYHKKSGSLEPEKIVISANLETKESVLEITNEFDIAVKVVNEVTVHTFILPTLDVPIAIGPFVLVVPFTQKILIKMLPIEISGKLKVNVLPLISATLGYKYENSVSSNLSTYNIDAAVNPLDQINLSPNLSVTAKATMLNPVYEIAPMGLELLKGFFEVPNDLELTVQKAQPNYSIKYKLDVTGGIKLKFFTGFDQEYSITGHVIDKTILEGNWPAPVVTLPSVTTTSISAITQTTAQSGGNVTSDGNANITARGICWSISPNPTTANNKTINGTGTGSFTSSLTGLNANTTYYVRAYATNSAGTGYGNEISFITASSPAVTFPSVTTTSISAITQTTAQGGGNVTSDGNATVTSRGICWSTSANPTTANNKSTDGNGTGSFTSSLTGLTANTTYNVRAYATNSAGTGYGNNISFTTLQTGGGTTVTDFDGNMYNTITIGTQVWMKENLKVTHYRNGDPLPNVTDESAWENLRTGAYCNNYNNISFGDVYGRMYNWYALNDSRNIVPLGWHVPSDAEWTTLINYLGGESIAGGKLKEIGTSHWLSPNVGATNETGFTALPGGNRILSGSFQFPGQSGDWWSTTEFSTDVANWWYMRADNTTVLRSGSQKTFGMSIRCIKD